MEPLVPVVKEGGRPASYTRREIVHAILDVLGSGCGWRMLPHDFPPWGAVYGYFRRWRKAGIFARMPAMLRREVRQQAGRDPDPRAGSSDSQSVRRVVVAACAALMLVKRGKGRKRPILVDTLGLLVCVLVLAANVLDRDAAKQVGRRARRKRPRLFLLWADGGDAGKLVDGMDDTGHWLLVIIKRSDNAKGFELLPRRGVVERSFAWLGNYRRLSKDDELLPATSEARISLAMSRLMLRCLARS